MNEKIIEILKCLIEIDNSGKDESKCVEKILEILSEYRFKYEIIKSKFCGRDSLVIEVGNLKSKNNNIAFIGHMDTVSPGELYLWKKNPFRGKVEGDKFYGRGASDMKGGLTAMIILLMDILKNKIELKKK